MNAPIAVARVRRLPVLPKVNAALCGPCGGKCCKNAPGLTVPEDWESMEALEAALRSGDWGLRTWWGDPLERVLERRLRRHGRLPVRPVDRVLIPRPAILGAPGSDFGDEGQCVHLRHTGCSLGDRKPFQCRELVPRGPEAACWLSPEHHDEQIALRWRSRAAVVDAIALRVFG